jgi:CHRD domain
VTHVLTNSITGVKIWPVIGDFCMIRGECMNSNFLRMSSAVAIIVIVALVGVGTQIQAQPAQATPAATLADEGKYPPCPDVVPQPTAAATTAATKGAAPAATMAATAMGTMSAAMQVGPFEQTKSCTLVAEMLGPNEVPKKGPANARGNALLLISRPDTGPGEICFQLDAFNIKLPATAAHIHAGPAGVAGPIVVPLAPPDAFNHSRGCTKGVDRALITQILTHPYDFYVNVHTTDFPGGVMRGQIVSKVNG